MGSSKEKPFLKGNASTIVTGLSGPVQKQAPNIVDCGGFPPNPREDETDPQTSDGHKFKSKGTEAAHSASQPAHPAGGPSRERPSGQLQMVSPEMPGVTRMTAMNTHGVDIREPAYLTGSASRLGLDNLTIYESEHEPYTSDHVEATYRTAKPSHARLLGKRPGNLNRSGGEQSLRQQPLDSVFLSTEIPQGQLALYHSESPTRLPRTSTPPEPMAQVQPERSSGAPRSTTNNAGNEGSQKEMYASERPARNAPSAHAWSDAGDERTDYNDTDADPRRQARERSTFGGAWKSGDADTNDEGSFAEQRRGSSSARPRGATPGQGFNTVLEAPAPARREVEGTYGHAAPSLAIDLQGNRHSAAPPRKDTGQREHAHTSSYGHDEPYSNPLGQGPNNHDATSDICYRQRERQGSLQLRIGRGLHHPSNPLPQHLGDNNMHEARGAGVSDEGATIGNVNVNCPREPALQTAYGHRGRGRQPTPDSSAVITSQPAPPQPIVPDRRQDNTAHSRNDVDSGDQFSGHTSNASYDRERSTSVSPFDRLPTQISPTASARLQRREERGYNLNLRSSPILGHTSSSRRPATHRNFAQSVTSRRSDQPSRPRGETHQSHTQYEPVRDRPRQAKSAGSGRQDGQEENIWPDHDLEDWRTLIPQARQVLGRLGEFLSPELCDGLTRLAMRAAEAPYLAPAELAHGARPAGGAEYTRQLDCVARPQPEVQQGPQVGDSRRTRPGLAIGNSRWPEGGGRDPMTRRAEIGQAMAVRNVLNSPGEGQTQRQEQGNENEGAEGSGAPTLPPGPQKPRGKRPPGRPRKDDPYRPEPRRKSVAPLPGEKPHVGRPKNVEIQTREQYHGGKLDYSAAVDTIKTVSKGTQFVPTSTGEHDQLNANVEQTSQLTVLNPPLPEPSAKPGARRPPGTRYVSRAVQETRGEAQTQSVPQPSTEATRQLNPTPTVPISEKRAPATEAAEPAADNQIVVGVRGRFPGGTPTYVYKNVPEQQIVQPHSTSTTVGALRRSARTASRQGSAQPIPAPRNINAASRPLHRINENTPSQTQTVKGRMDKRGEAHRSVLNPASENRPSTMERTQTYHEQVTGMGRVQALRPGSSGGTFPPSQSVVPITRAPAKWNLSAPSSNSTRVRGSQQPVYVQESVEDVHMSDSHLTTGLQERLQDGQEGTLQQGAGTVAHVGVTRPATRSNTKRKSPSMGEADNHGNDSVSPKKQKRDLRMPSNDTGEQA